MSQEKPALKADFNAVLEAALRARSEDADGLAGGHRVADPNIREAIAQLLSSPA